MLEPFSSFSVLVFSTLAFSLTVTAPPFFSPDYARWTCNTSLFSIRYPTKQAGPNVSGPPPHRHPFDGLVFGTLACNSLLRIASVGSPKRKMHAQASPSALRRSSILRWR